MPLKPVDFAEELQAILGTASGPHALTSQQPACGADARITPQLYDAANILEGHVEPLDIGAPAEVLKPWRIRGARRGDILLCPGGPSGMVGAMLSALSPPQMYSHCGLLLDDGLTIRHCTTMDSHVEMHPVGSIAGLDIEAPIDGFQENAVRFGWPGTLTQNVEDAWRFSRQEEPADKWISDPRLPASTQNRFWVHALSFAPTMQPPKPLAERWATVWPVLVQPCFKGASAAHAAEVVDALDRVASAGESLRGHYRTYTYTDAAPRGGPAMPSSPPLIPDTGVRPPGAMCTGSGGVFVPTASTQGFMCSSFIWHAVQTANQTRPAGAKRILLDGRQAGLPVGARCDRSSDVERKPYPADRIDPATLDGLYFYPEALRKQAAEELYKKITEKVVAAIAKLAPGWLQAAGAGTTLSLPQLLAAIGAGPLSQVAALLGISAVLLEEILLVVTNAPDRIANQIGSGFAFDDCTGASVGLTTWREAPGVGRTVSPDDILHNWAPPTNIVSPAHAADNLLGLYGSNTRLVMDPPSLRRRPIPPVTWQISQGFGMARGRVFYRTLDAGGVVQDVPLPQARVRIGGTTLLTNNQGEYLSEKVPSGRFWLDADFVDGATGLEYTFDGDVALVPLAGPYIRDIELNAPSSSSREIAVAVKADLLQREAMPWDDAWRQHLERALPPCRLGLDFFPNDPAWAAQRAQATNHVFYWGADISDVFTVDVLLEVHLEDDASLTVKVRSRMRDHGTVFKTDTTAYTDKTVTIAPRSETLKQYGLDLLAQFNEDVKVQIDRGGVLPTHAWIHIQVLNLQG